MQVRKRNGNIVEYDREFIVRAVTLAAAAAGEHGDEAVQRVVDGVEIALTKRQERIVDIETIQDAVEQELFEQGRFRTAKAYILYRMDKEKTRGLVEWKDGLLLSLIHILCAPARASGCRRARDPPSGGSRFRRCGSGGDVPAPARASMHCCWRGGDCR